MIKKPSQPVDIAMMDKRPEKRVVRRLWIDEVKKAAELDPDAKEPWYLTLPGAEGHDITLLVEEGLIELTETKAISERDVKKVVAVESRNDAFLELVNKFTGLRIKDVHFRSLIRGDHVFSWPSGEDERFCRARVVNLDLNSPLQATIKESRVTFPIVAWIAKLSEIHGKSPRLDWSLCLTLHGELDLPAQAELFARELLRDNVQRESEFATACEALLGASLMNGVISVEGERFSSLSQEDQQRLLMVLVPKLIVQELTGKGWRVSTTRNLRYGGGRTAPIVTWIFHFVWDHPTHSQPDASYRSALKGILENSGYILSDGRIIRGSEYSD